MPCRPNEQGVPEATFPLIGIGSDDFDATPVSVLLNRVRLVLRRVLLMLRGHTGILRGAHPTRAWLVSRSSSG